MANSFTPFPEANLALRRKKKVRFSPMVDRIAARGADAWSIHMEAARLRDQGQDVIFLTVGDPDQARAGAGHRRDDRCAAPPSHRILLDHRLSQGPRGDCCAGSAAHRTSVPRRQRRRDARRTGRGLLRAAVPCRPGRRSHCAGADLQHLRSGDRRERRPPGDGGVACRVGLSSGSRCDRRRCHAAHPRNLDQQPA